MVSVYFTSFDQELQPAIFNNLLGSIPSVFTESIKKYNHWEDSHASLFGKLLLRRALSYHELNLENVKIDPNKKPYVSADINFNISHSGRYVVCAISTETIVGIDIEQIKIINPVDFEKVFAKTEHDEIKNALNPLNRFYEYWTMKEAAIKADGRGLGLSFQNIQIQGSKVFIEEKPWQLKPLMIAEGYVCHLAIKEGNQYIGMKNISFY